MQSSLLLISVLLPIIFIINLLVKQAGLMVWLGLVKDHDYVA